MTLRPPLPARLRAPGPGWSTTADVIVVGSGIAGLTVALTARAAGHSVLLVTSDFHTRRALATFQNELHGRTFYVASAPDARNFGSPWWRHRQWAKVFFDECVRLAWWELVDRWR